MSWNAGARKGWCSDELEDGTKVLAACPAPEHMPSKHSRWGEEVDESTMWGCE